MANSTPSNDTTLSLINSSASQLRQTQSTLDVPHARDSHLVTINHLPTEILCYIFRLTKVYCTIDALSHHRFPRPMNEDKPGYLFSPENISPVCVYWRNLLNNTPALWTHVDLSIGRLQDANFTFHALRSLERAKQLPLHIHVSSNRETGDSQVVVASLAPYANRIISLDLSGNVFTAQSILLDLFSIPYCGSVQRLYLHDEDFETLRRLQGRLFSSRLLDEFLLSISSLTLEGPSLDYNSPTFRDLTELALIFSDMSPTPYQLTQILAACPALRSFTLINIMLTPGNLPSSAANLSSLQILDLRYVSLDDVATITSCIIPRRGLSMSLTLNMDDDSHIRDLSPLLPFFKQFHVSRLFLNSEYVSEGLDLRAVLGSLRDPLPSLEELALDVDLFRGRELEGGLLAERFPRLHTLHIIGSTVPVDRLKMMLASSPIRVVQFRWRERHPSEVLHAISKVVSSVLYSLHDTLMDNRPFPWELPSISYYDNGLL